MSVEDVARLESVIAEMEPTIAPYTMFQHGTPFVECDPGSNSIGYRIRDTRLDVADITLVMRGSFSARLVPKMTRAAMIEHIAGKIEEFKFIRGEPSTFKPTPKPWRNADGSFTYPIGEGR